MAPIQENGIKNEGMGKEIYLALEKEFNPEEGTGKMLFDELILHGDKIAQIDAVTGDKETYKCLLSKSIRIAQNLRLKELKPGDIISICCYNNMIYTATALASFFLGTINASMDPTAPLVDQIHCLEITSPKIIFCDKELEGQIEQAVKQSGLQIEVVVFGESVRNIPISEYLKKVEPEEDFIPYKVTNFKSTACIHFSSGTTGVPKAVCVTHYGLIFASLDFKGTTGEGKTVMIVTSPFWISNMNTMISNILAGNTRIIVKQFDEKTCLKYIEKYKIECLLITPANGAKLIENPKNYEGYDTSTLTTFMTGGSTTYPKQFLAYMKIFPNAELIQGYGMTETGGLVIKPCSLDFKDVKLLKKPCIGTPVPGFLYKLVDPMTEKMVGPHEEGELRIKYEGVMSAYYNNSKAYAEAFDSEGFLKTGDIVYYDENYRFFYVNRIKEIFKYLGWHISPIIIETELLKHPDVEQAVVFGVPTETEGEFPTAAVIADENIINEDQIVQFIKERLPDRYQLRGGVFFVKEFPATATGKLLRRKLSEMVLKMKNINNE